MKKVLLIGGGVLATLIVGVFAVGVAGAQDGHHPGQELISRVAEKLGISDDQLTTAMTDAQNEIIDGKVASGELTQGQADKLKGRIAEYGPLSILGDARRGHQRECRGAHFIGDAAATVLGMDPADLAAQLKSGQNLLQVAESHGMSADDFTPALLAQVKTGLDAKVGEGKLTQEQTDHIYSGIEKNIDRIVNFVPPADGGPCRPRQADSPPDGAVPSPQS
jgi:uncharacterized protein YidB (DUF937 family)